MIPDFEPEIDNGVQRWTWKNQAKSLVFLWDTLKANTSSPVFSDLHLKKHVALFHLKIRRNVSSKLLKEQSSEMC